MQQKFGICLQCKQQKPINSRQICPDCIYSNNHQGKSKQEVLLEKQKTSQKPIKNFELSRNTSLRNKPLKHSKKRIKQSNKSKEKKDEMIRKDEELYEYIFNTRPPYCEECGTRLPDEFRDEEGRVIMRSQYSHMLSKGAWQIYRHEKWNMQRLCFTCHQVYEFGDRKSMNTYQESKKKVLRYTGLDLL